MTRSPRSPRSPLLAAVLGVVVLMIGIGSMRLTRIGVDRTEQDRAASTSARAAPSAGSREEGSDARVVDLRTGTVTKLPPAIASVHQDCCYSVSPDGTQIAFVGKTGGGSEGPWRYGVYLTGADGAFVRPVYRTITETPFPHHDGGARLIGTPQWSPDGSRLVYHQDYGDAIVIVDITTGVATMVADKLRLYEGPAFSRDGRTILFSRGSGLWTVPVAGGHETRLIGPGLFGTYSPDGGTIAYTRPFSAGGYLGIWLADADGSHRHPGPSLLAAGGPMGAMWGPMDQLAVRLSRAAWSPDGRRIAASMYDGMPVVVVDLRTGESRTVATSGVPVWLDDHRLIIDHYGKRSFSM